MTQTRGPNGLLFFVPLKSKVIHDQHMDAASIMEPIKIPLQVKLEAQLGPDPLNPCADLACIGGRIQTRILQLQAEIKRLEAMQENIMRGIDKFAPGWKD